MVKWASQERRRAWFKSMTNEHHHPSHQPLHQFLHRCRIQPRSMPHWSHILSLNLSPSPMVTWRGMCTL